jgi:hypothetical protein
MSETKLEGKIYLKIIVFNSSAKAQVVNLKSFEGWGTDIEDRVETYGFDIKGNPIFDASQNMKYKLEGTMAGGINLNYVFLKGIVMNKKRIVGLEAVRVMLSRNGCAPMSTEQLQKTIDDAIKNGFEKLCFFKKSNLNGMGDGYGFSNEWLTSGKIPTVDYDGFNDFLKGIHSDWRILTKKTKKLMQTLQVKKLMSEES